MDVYAKSVDELLQEFDSSRNGLSAREAKERLKKNGLNLFTVHKETPLFLQFLAKFLNPLVLILIFASALTALLGELIHFLVIFSIVLVSVVVDFYQEYAANVAAAKLKKRVSLKVAVFRQKVETVPATHLVVGDIILLRSGDIIPADCRVIEANQLLINQSVLTGESFPQQKTIDILPSDTSAEQRTNMLFMGTSVVSGEGRALVVATADETEFGEIIASLTLARPETEFSRGIKQFGNLLLKISLILVVIVLITNLLLGHSLLNSFLFALALSVGLTPELLPIIVTINLARGATRMSNSGVIVKDLPAIENFGSMQVLCTDKTGTLTEDRIELELYEDIEGAESEITLQYAILNSMHQTGIASPLDSAILKHDLNILGFKKIKELPFDFERRMLSVGFEKNNESILITKGAPESVVMVCSSYLLNDKKHKMDAQARRKIQERFEHLSKQGFRVLAVAVGGDEEKNLEFVGLMAFLDPAKLSAKVALSSLQDLGVEIKILTGDNELVTSKICEDLDLKSKGLITGLQYEKLSLEQKTEAVKSQTIFARLSPEQKVEIVTLLKKSRVVGYMGDGINDSASLHVADIGISVENAVDVAKQSADLILLHKDLGVLVSGVREGRITYGNIMKYIKMVTSSNFGNMFTLSIASVFLPFLPMLPAQILLGNLLYDLSQLSIYSDRVDEEYLRTAKQWDISGIKHFMLLFGPVSSIFDFATFGILLLIMHSSESTFQTGWFVESLISQTIIIFAVRTKLPFWRSNPSLALSLSVALVVILALVLPYSFAASWFGFVVMPGYYFLFLGLILVSFVFSIELAKRFYYRRYSL